MHCPRCPAQNEDKARFCVECGARLEELCPSCGSALSSGKRFCGSCGSAVPGWYGSPGSYTPKYLAEQILASRSLLEGERKQVTILFADMKGSMELLADRDPEEAQRILDPVLEHMMEAVHRYEGTVNQVMGDGIMGLFGAPIGHEDHAMRACYAALRMRETVRGWSARAALSHPVLLRIGLNSGEVVVRSIGNDLRMDYTAVGRATHLAARMEQLAAPDTILMAAETHRLAMDHVVAQTLGPRSVKGLEAPLEVYELLSAGAPRSRFHAASARELTPFVGRQRELAQLEDAAASIGVRGRGQVIAFVGEPGVGKSRLIWEFLHHKATAEWQVVETGCYSYTTTTTDHLIITLLRTFFAVDPNDTAHQVREKVAGKIDQLGEIPSVWRTAVLWLLEALGSDPDWDRRTNADRREVTLAAVRGILFAASRRQPLLLVLEDLHWIDSGSQAVLDVLVAGLPAQRILLVVSYRPEYRHTWASRTYYQLLRVNPLPEGDAEHLLEGILDPDLGPLKRRLVERTEGNPFFLEESVRSLIQARGLTKDPQLPTAVSLDIPATVHAVIASRIDRASPEAKRLLQAASAIGTQVPLDLLAAVTDTPEERLRATLDELQAAEFLYERHLYPEIWYTFHHSLTHEVAYESLLHDRRRALHAKIAESMERLYEHRLHDHVEDLARHAVQGERWERAVRWLRQAGAKAFARSAHEAAIGYFEQALDACRRLPETTDRLELAIDLRFDLRNSLFATGDHSRATSYVEEAERIASRLGDQRRQAWASCYLMMHSLVMGQPRRTIEHGGRARAAGLELGETALVVVANLGLGQAQHALGQYGDAIRSLEESLAGLEPIALGQRFGMNSPPAIQCYTWLAWCHAERGDFAAGLARGEAGLGLADRVQDPWGRASAHYGLGLVRLRQGDFPEAIRWLSAGLEISKSFGMRTWLPALGSALGYTYALAGDSASALPLLERAVAEAEQQNVMFRHSLRIGWLAEAQLRAGQRDTAVSLARRALDLAQEREEHGHEAYALWLLGRTSDNVGEAVGFYNRAIKRAHQLGLLPLLGHCLFGRGEAYRRSGDTEAAREAFTEAARLMSSLGMTTWLADANAALEQLGSPRLG